MDAKDRREFATYLYFCTDRQVRGVYEKEREAHRYDYAELATIEADKRGISLQD